LSDEFSDSAEKPNAVILSEAGMTGHFWSAIATVDATTYTKTALTVKLSRSC
jgi:hypothetical protein